MVVIREHLIRYTLVLQDIFNKDVLDIACGTGYGMYLMSYWAKSISGYDIDEGAIGEAKRDFRMKAPAYFDVRDLDEDIRLTSNIAQNFDVITCFETLEYLENPERLIINIKKHLKPKGIFYFSTPNKPFLVDDSEWHKSVFNLDIWNKLLTKYFPNKETVIWGQDQYGLTNDMNKPFLVGRVKL